MSPKEEIDNITIEVSDPDHVQIFHHVDDKQFELVFRDIVRVEGKRVGVLHVHLPDEIVQRMAAKLSHETEH